MFGGYFLNIHDTSGSETDVNFQRMCQKFILQKERQVFIKCILRNVHNSYVFVHIGRRYCGRETVTPSTPESYPVGRRTLQILHDKSNQMSGFIVCQLKDNR